MPKEFGIAVSNWWHRNLDSSLEPEPDAPPERRLICAILERAARDLEPVVDIRKEDRSSAIRWFKGYQELGNDGFTYTFVADYLDLTNSEKSYLREKVKVAEIYNSKLIREEINIDKSIYSLVIPDKGRKQIRLTR